MENLLTTNLDKIAEIESSKSSSNASGTGSNQDITSSYGFVRMGPQRTFLGNTGNNNNTNLYNSIRNTLKINCGVSILQKQTFISPKNSNPEEKRDKLTALLQKTSVLESKPINVPSRNNGTSIEDVRKLIQNSCNFFLHSSVLILILVGQRSFFRDESTAPVEPEKIATTNTAPATTTMIPDFTKVASDHSPLMETVNIFLISSPIKHSL